MNRPNILIFCTDQMRADHLACTGNSIIKTPNLDRLAARGTVFKRSYCNNPICMPARATMFTGLLPRDHGLRVNGQTLRPDIPTLAGTLAEAGYRTHAAGKLHLSPWVPKVNLPCPESFPECLQYWQDKLIDYFPTPYYGFQTVDFVGGHTSYAYGSYQKWLLEQGGDPALLSMPQSIQSAARAPFCYKMSMPEELHYNRYISDSTINVLREDRSKPFFIWCSFPDPHLPVAPPRPYCDMYDPDTIPLPSGKPDDLASLPAFYKKIFNRQMLPDGQQLHEDLTPEQVKELIALTYGMISHIDAEIGRVLDELEDSGLINDTLIVFISDHGDMMGDHGLYWKGPYTYNGCTNIPTIVSAPGLPGGLVSNALTSQIDLFPSILDYCSVDLPGADWSDHKDFAWGQEQDIALYPGKSWLPILEGRKKLHDEIIIENDYLSTGFKVRCMVTDNFRITIYPGTNDGELFDVKKDPGEMVNLWYKPQYENLKLELLRQMLDAYSRNTPHYPIPPWNS